jgi:uncharacterized protein YgbK (DUF1537 family)
MPKLIVIADDLTGALDTGVQFAKHGIETRVFPDGKMDLSQLFEVEVEAQVAVVNTASRHISADEAYRIVFDAVSTAKANGFDYFYKKTDSVLRGNIGAELSAVSNALKEPVSFVPAYPALGRTTVDGIHYVDGVPLAETAFGSDPFSPLASSVVETILLQSGALENAGIEVFDAASDSELLRIANSFKQEKKTIFAGCAGFAAFLPEMIGFHQKQPVFANSGAGLFVITGSVNPITLGQIECAKQSGFPSIIIPKELKTAYEVDVFQQKEFINEATSVFRANNRLILSSIAADKGGFIETIEPNFHGIIARNIGGIAAALMSQLDAAFFLIGGDVLLECIKQFKPDSMQPLSEPVPGIVFVKLRKGSLEIDLYTKSGGFGSPNDIVKIAEQRKK